ncbi:phasin family protein [Clostridium sp. C8-1-8]|uniref:phasin family protein n=1 Tax=Clostridium sp. C8-1-8 TaxID=2698831 RepID=UPI00136B6034|nr:phasin family protein [Clostridium sp. C8-1-8]
MFNELKKVMLAGVGAVATTYEKANEIVNDMVEKGKITVDEGKELSEELLRDFKGKASTTTNKVMDKIDDMMPLTKQELNTELQDKDIPTRIEFDALKDRVEYLENKLSEIIGKVAIQNIDENKEQQ